MTTIRITQVVIRSEPKNDFIFIDPSILEFQSDPLGRSVYRILEYELATIEENITVNTKHFEVGKRGDYLIRGPDGNLKVYSEAEYKKL